jgi:hypothetical protein
MRTVRRHRSLSPGIAFALFSALLAGGCTSGTIPDPNDPNDVGNAQPEVLRNDLKGAADSLFDRVNRGELTVKQAQNYLAAYADKLVSGLKVEKVPVGKAWEYGQVFYTARRWKHAKVFYEIAVAHAVNDDRRINDSIKLAAVDCQLGDVPSAVALMRATFKSPPTAKAPILIGTLLEVVPAGEGKGHDVELAQLLEDAIPQAEETVVDPNTIAGRMYLIARPHHVANAWLKIVHLFNAANRPDLAQKAGEMAAKSRPEQHTI